MFKYDGYGFSENAPTPTIYTYPWNDVPLGNYILNDGEMTYKVRVERNQHMDLYVSFYYEGEHTRKTPCPITELGENSVLTPCPS